MVISLIIDMRKNKPHTSKQIKLAADKELLKSRPLLMKLNIKTPKTMRTIIVPKSPPEPPQPEPIQKMWSSILPIKSKIPVVFETADKL